MTYHIMPTQKINWYKLSSIYYGPYKIMCIKTKIIVKTLNDVIKKNDFIDWYKKFVLNIMLNINNLFFLCIVASL